MRIKSCIREDQELMKGKSHISRAKIGVRLRSCKLFPHTTIASYKVCLFILCISHEKFTFTSTSKKH